MSHAIDIKPNRYGRISLSLVVRCFFCVYVSEWVHVLWWCDLCVSLSLSVYARFPARSTVNRYSTNLIIIIYNIVCVSESGTKGAENRMLMAAQVQWDCNLGQNDKQRNRMEAKTTATTTTAIATRNEKYIYFYFVCIGIRLIIWTVCFLCVCCSDFA